MTLGITGPYKRLGIFVAAAALLMLLVGVGANSEEMTMPDRRSTERRPTAATGRDLTAEFPVLGDPATVTDSEPTELPDAVVITLAGLAGVGFLYLLSRQRFAVSLARRRLHLARSATTIEPREEAEAVASIARDLIDELNTGGDPRQAIQRAYAAVETGFGSKEFERKAAETPLQYLARIFGNHRHIATPLDRLTALFQRARFSDAPIDESMRTEAIAALGEVRDYYQNVSWRRIDALAAAR